MSREYRKAAGDKARAAGYENAHIKQYGNKADCTAYVERDTWAASWPGPTQIKTKAAPEPADAQTLDLFATVSPGDTLPAVDQHQNPEAATMPESMPDQEQPPLDLPPKKANQGQPADGGAPLLLFSTFPMSKATTPKRIRLNRETFLKLLAKHDVRREKEGKLFAPATFKGPRCKGNFIAASGLCLDFDHGQPTIEQVLGPFPETLAAYYTTHSHTPEAPRFRVVLPLSRPVDAKEHARLVQGVKSIIPLKLMGYLDKRCFEMERQHYLPSCPPEHRQNAFTGHQEGEPLSVERFMLLGAAVAQAEATERREPATPPPRAFEFIDRNTGEMVNLTAWAAQNPSFDIMEAVGAQYRRGSVKDGKQHIVCPFESQHTDQGDDRATFVANASPPKYNAWEVHCCHAHCEGRDRLEYLLAMLEKGWMSADQLQVAAPAPAHIEKRRPPKVYYHVNDILAAPEWSTLLPDERRIAFDLMAMAWAEEDGTIADNNWMIARRLGIPERDWMAYRGTLTRTGWLIEFEGRLTNDIVKREFDLAQGAYMKAIIGGGIGGRKSAAKRGASTPPLTPP